jgi:hypothetical protein
MWREGKSPATEVLQRPPDYRAVFFCSFLVPGERAVHRDHLELIQCVWCAKWYVIRVSSADLRRHRDGLLAQDAFPYLPADLRELLITATCPDCWDRLCVDPVAHPTAYS